MSVLVYQAINAITAELAATGIPKSRCNEDGHYAYRSIDDVLGALAPLLAQHSLCVLPRILSREAVRSGRASQLVTVHVAFDLVSALDGSAHTIESFGEALDDSDKGTAKATSSAYKSAMVQAFCIPVPQDDAEATSPQLSSRINDVAHPEPPEGWDAWAGEVIVVARSCESAEAIDRLMAMRRPLLAALQRSRPELYAAIGEAIANQLHAIQQPFANHHGTSTADGATAERTAKADIRSTARSASSKARATEPSKEGADAEREAPQAA